MLDIQKYIWTPKIVCDELDSRTSVFELNYVPRWFGHTLWNALRRTILWYNVGWAITWLIIKWVSHEYVSIDWVKESAFDIMLNMKKLRFKIDENIEKLQWVSQKFKWIKKYTSDDLKLPAWVEILTKDHVLFEISDPSVELVIDYRLEKWYDYYTMDFLRKREEKNEDTDANILLIDNHFNLIEYFKYRVEESIWDFVWWSKDKLIIEIKTISDKISPKELLSFAWEVVSSYSKLFVFDETYIDKSVMIEYEELHGDDKKIEEEYNQKIVPIDALSLSERTRNALIKNQILYVEDLEKKRKSELLSMKWVWRKAVDEIVVSLEDIDKKLAG